MATGLLIVLLNKSTKLSNYFLRFQKEYLAVIKLGIETDTWDADGRVIHSGKVKRIDPRTIENILFSFKGEYMQMPPIYSSLKYKGRPAYKYAREGKEISLEKRKVNISEISLIDYAKDNILLKITCSSGTYVRSIAHDIGKRLGCGASLWNLRRIKIGDFDVKDSLVLERIRKITDDRNSQSLIGVEQIFKDSDTIMLKKEALKKVENGNPLVPDMIEKIKDKKRLSEFVKLKRNNRLIAIYRTRPDCIYKVNEDKKNVLANLFILL